MSYTRAQRESQPPLDKRRRAEEDGTRQLLDHFLYFFSGPSAMLYAYLDESSTHEGAPAMCVAGILYDRKSMKRLDGEWKKELEWAGIRSFHKVDSGHLHGEFQGKSPEFADQLYRRLVGIIKKYTCGSVAVCVRPKGEFDVFQPGKSRYSQYTVCSFMCMSLIISLARRLGHKQVSYFIESGHENMGELATVLKQQRTSGWPGMESHNFSEKDSLRPLQTADTLAYEVTKRLKDMVQEPERRLRKSLGAIIGESRDHIVAVVTSRMLRDFLSRMP